MADNVGNFYGRNGLRRMRMTLADENSGTKCRRCEQD